MYRNTLLAITIVASSGIYAAPIHDAIENGDTKQVKQILTDNKEALSQQDQYGYYPIHLAAKTGNTKILQILVDHGAHVNRAANIISPDALPQDQKGISKQSQKQLNRKMTPLEVAAESGNTKATEFFVQQGATIEQSSLTLFMIAKRGYTKIMKLLVQAGADLTTKLDNNMTLLHIAARNLQPDMVQYLLQQGLNPNAKTVDVSTPLKEAILSSLTEPPQDKNAENSARKNLTQIVQILLQHGANPNIQDDAEETALHKAIQPGLEDTVRILLDNNANPNIPNHAGRTPLHEAALSIALTSMDMNVAQMLITSGAHVNATDENNATPLHLAAAFGDKQLVSLLLQHGAHPNIKTSSQISPKIPRITANATPRDLAQQSGYTEIVAMLDTHDQQPESTPAICQRCIKQ